MNVQRGQAKGVGMALFAVVVAALGAARPAQAEKLNNLRVGADTIDTLGKAVLGLTIACARCHDHKYDPITSRDYYALYGIFDSTRYPFPGCEKTKTIRDMVLSRAKPRSNRILRNQSQIARLHWAEPYLLHGCPLRHVLDTLKLALQLGCASKPKISVPGRLDCGRQFEV